MGFTRLHLYTGYSFLKSALTVPKAVGFAKKMGAEFISVCDFGSLSGAPELAKLAPQYGLKPLYGMDALIDGNLFSLFVENENGYRNLLQICLKHSQKSLDLPFLKGHLDGLIVVLDGHNSFLAYADRGKFPEIARTLAAISEGIPCFCLGLPYEEKSADFVNFLREFAAKYPYSLIAFPHIRYGKKEDAISLAILEAIAKDEQLAIKELSGDQCFLDDETATNYFTESERNAAREIAERCSSFQLIQKRGGLLKYPCPAGETSESYLRRLALEGLTTRLGSVDENYQTRLAYELDVITKMGYADYFLIVADYVAWAKANGVSVGPGRGSGAGSLVSFALGIVKPDPLKYDLLFERFLNPERQSMPDIDVDFADVSRDKVVAYLQQKYGKSRVSHIMTMQTLGAKASLRDIGRIYGYRKNEVDLLCGSLSDAYPTLRENYKRNLTFRKLVDSDKYYLEFVSLAAKIEGLPRQSGLHAAGIVLNDKPLEDCIPITDQPSVGYVDQFEMDHLQEQGFLKMDLLGLSNLSIIDSCLQNIEKTSGKRLCYDDIPYDDAASIALIAEGKTMGLFQLESEGMNRAIREVKPTTFEDIVAILALYRPGPMQNIPAYGRRKAGHEKVSYLLPEWKPILESTYGIIVYQEQIMQIVRVTAGFSYAQADMFRRAISKKDAQKLASLKPGFIEGCIAHGHTKEIGEQAYDLIERFADYGFNKSHALCYAILSCQMAYLKCHYPLCFYGAVLDHGGGGPKKVGRLISEIRRRKIRFLVPSINEAENRFVLTKTGLMYPLSGIKDVNGPMVSAILNERMVDGPFEDIFDFAVRLKSKNLKVTDLVRLINAGCFDGEPASRASLRLTAPLAISYAEVKVGNGGQMLLLDFALPKPSYAEASADPLLDLELEREALGAMVSGSPLIGKDEVIKAMRLSSLLDVEEGKETGKCAAIVGSIKTMRTKKGTDMGILSVYDDCAEMEFTLFDEALKASANFLKEGALIAIAYRREVFQGREKYVATLIEQL